MPHPSVTVRPFSLGTEEPGLDNDPMLHLTRVFVYFLQNLFRDFPPGCGMTWRPNEETTELMITAEKPRQEAVEKKPHITCVLGSARWSGLGIDQLQSRRASDGQRTHSDLIPMTMSYHCMAREGLQARRLAWNASFYTNVLRRVLIRVGGLHHVGVQHDISAETGSSAYTGPTTEDELVTVVVTVPFYWQTQWRISEASTVWRKMRILLSVREVKSFIRTADVNALRPPRVRGVPVKTIPLEPGPPVFTQTVLETESVGEE